MDTDGQAYSAPAAAAMATTQDSLAALRLLIAQRSLYSKAKDWTYLRWIGLSVMGIAAPFVAMFIPVAAVSVAAVAGVWIFLSRTVFNALESKRAAQGAAVQEDFDRLVFAMPLLATREPRPAPEDIATLVGPDAQVPDRAKQENLYGWYPMDRTVAGVACVAIAQRANAAYSERLLRLNARYWLVVLAVWTAVIVLVSVVRDLQLSTFLLGVAAPLLPAYLDVSDQWRASAQACTDRRSMAEDIERAVRDASGKALTDDDLLVWQERLYGLRRSSPLVPNLIYKRTWERNEQAMNAAAAELWAAARRRQLGANPEA
ncbi:S-4TM family putative pore-forming effector [Mycolicibacter arupensis]|uniref:Uncharacterized protein n=1 Tax=Mycolicibacter arupensis TaxID=342002 RepID=A0A0F5N076_9MYCO|nr:S-4TM family putative pore-forming effector [Mycolicibacter arupensis]KKC00362.1 hypothetical protein WR43_05540 [Mycolicibacter arupensis]MCV7277703.1 hypothetical protein [Mycolicibacter arupensis]OQZ95312.1 hypothetical protein BST15_14435 [Mycolicibacter arupensis]